MASPLRPTTSADACEAPIAVLRDTGSKVVLSIAVPGLKKRNNWLCGLFQKFRKPSNPFRLVSNVKFGEYSLTNGSLSLVMEVYESKQALKQASEARQKYVCKIDQFPSRINPESAEFELLQGRSGECYFLLTCIKLDNYQTNWKEFLATHGTLDIAKI